MANALSGFQMLDQNCPGASNTPSLEDLRIFLERNDRALFMGFGAEE